MQCIHGHDRRAQAAALTVRAAYIWPLPQLRPVHSSTRSSAQHDVTVALCLLLTSLSSSNGDLVHRVAVYLQRRYVGIVRAHIIGPLHSCIAQRGSSPHRREVRMRCDRADVGAGDVGQDCQGDVPQTVSGIHSVIPYSHADLIAGVFELQRLVADSSVSHRCCASALPLSSCSSSSSSSISSTSSIGKAYAVPLLLLTCEASLIGWRGSRTTRW